MFTHSVPLLKTDLNCLENSPYRWAFPLINYQLRSGQEETKMSFPHHDHHTKTTTYKKTYEHFKLGNDFSLSKSQENLANKSEPMDSLDLNNNPVMDSKIKNLSKLNEYDPYAYGFRPLSEINVYRTFEVIPGKSSPSAPKTIAPTSSPVASNNNSNNKQKNVTTITFSKKIIKHNPSKKAPAAAEEAVAAADPAVTTTNGDTRSSAKVAFDEVDGPKKSTLKTSTKATNTDGDPVRIRSKCDLNYSERAIDVLKEWILPSEELNANGDEKNEVKVKDKPPQPPRLIIPPRTPTMSVKQSYKQNNSRGASGYRGLKNKNPIYRARSLNTFNEEDVLRLDPIPTKLQSVKCAEYEWLEMRKTKRVDWV